MKYRKLWVAILCTMAVNAGMTSCVDDDEEPCTTCGTEDDACGGTDDDYKGQVLILNQGSMGSVDASLCRYNSTNGTITPNLFSTINEISLGDTGQDMIYYDDQVYLTATGSKTVYRIGRCGILKKAYHADAEVRSLAAKDGKLYVSCYGGKVLKLNTETMEKEAELTVAENANLEGMTICDNMLYVAKSYSINEGNYIYHNTLEAINLNNFTHVAGYEVGVNPNDVLEEEDKVYVLSYGDYLTQGYSLGYITPGTETTYTHICPASKMASYNDIIYFAYSATDWSDWEHPATVTNFGSYNTKTGRLNETSFLKPSEATTKLASSSIYMIEINPDNGDFYISASDYVNHSTVYRFDREGNYITEFSTGGINACQAIFL